ncbi:hypothetical protein CMQ_1629 [Grosmannia clavigera kw1407]|uniref:Uncharacterized protein n=1 Tax=Grosmannia clavigera (strain kw1407 / UAMH 11150) TaxID=655863 RepID=F0XCM2_GROCL|nr:uncharacterized protein CMQ_1629 [Grosmannia clavigera kw1407]EFX04701.1 hypothetical protein CMQ_1629 [Grosmannia clavigera kw1407]
MCAASARPLQPLGDVDGSGRKKKAKKQLAEQSKPPPKVWMSNIIPLNLEENPASGRGRYSSMSVLEPVMRIERTGDIESATNPPSGGSEASYRIVVTFIFEVAISGFDQGFQKHNRFFDSVSLRYLFRHGEEVDLRPLSDSAQHGITVTNTRDKLNSIDAGMSAGMVTAVAPTLSVQAQRDFKLTYQRSMNSWRMGLSFESCEQSSLANGSQRALTLSKDPVPRPERSCLPLTSILAAHLVSRQQARPKRDRKIYSSSGQDLRQKHFFQVLSPHRQDCHCRPSRHSGCPLKYRHQRRHQYYNRAAHWFWQTEASLRLWTPEIYSSFRCPITVMREVPVAVADRVRRIEDLRPLLHFDFEVDTRLRVLGCGLNFFKNAVKPAELRAQTDTGQQLPGDHVRFCITCCAENISWPQHPTRNLQAEAEEALGPGPNPRRLQTNEEFSVSLRQRGVKRTRTAHSRLMDDSSSRSPLFERFNSPFQQLSSSFSSHQSSLPHGPSFSGDFVLGADRLPPPTVADVEISPACSRRCFVPDRGLLRRDGGAANAGSTQAPPKLVADDWRWTPAGRSPERIDLHNVEEAYQRSDHNPSSADRRRHYRTSEDKGPRPVLRRRTSLELLLARERRRSPDGHKDTEWRREGHEPPNSGRQQVRFQPSEYTDSRR